MTDTLYNRALALFAAALIIAPAAFMAATPPAKAITVENILNDSSWTSIKTAVESAYTAVKSAITSVAAVTSAAKETALVIERYVLQPLAYITTGNLLKKITSSILGFVGGKNGLGKPLYTPTRPYIQNVGDVEAYTFLNQFQSSSNSIFAGSIASSLRAAYLQGTTLAGFFAGNKSTLSDYSSDPKGFAAGNWGSGGWLAFLGLTTVDQNNPYLFYPIAQNQMRRQVQTADTAKLAELIQNQGFLNWCGTAGGTPAGGSGTTYDASGNPTDVTGTPEFNTVVPGSGGDYGGGYDCPAGAVKTGDVCGYEGTVDGGGAYVLPSGYSCPSGASFDTSFGACQTQDGIFTFPNDVSGNPAYPPGDESPTTDSVASGSGTNPSGAIGSAGGQALIARLNQLKPGSQGDWTKHLDWSGSATDGGMCWQWVRMANGLPIGDSSTVLPNSGYTKVSGGISSAVDGDIIQVYDPSTGKRHVEMLVGNTYVSDFIQKGSNPYHWAQPSAVQYTVWHPPAKKLGAVKTASSLVAAVATGSTGKVLGASSVYTGQVLGASTGTGSSVVPTGVRPGDPCTKADGTAGRVQTPGTIIKDYLSNALKASGLDKLVAGAGDLSTQISGIMGDIGAVMKTIDVASNLFGGSSSGLMAFSGNSSYTSPFASYLNSPSYMGITTNAVYSNPTTGTVAGSDLTTRVASYKSSWDTIGRTATDASTALNKLVTSCSAKASAAQAALANYVSPALASYASAKANIDAANGLIAQAATDANSASDGSAYTNDLLLEQTQAPTASDVANAEADARVEGTATADQNNTLSVSGGTTVDRMNMLTNNAQNLLANTAVCPPPPAPGG